MNKSIKKNHKLPSESQTTQKWEVNSEGQIYVDSAESEREDDHNSNILCYPSKFFTHETCQMSPLLFESDTDESSQSVPINCYQEKTSYSEKTKINVDCISPSPRLTRSTLLNSRVLTRSARRLLKVNDDVNNTSRKHKTKEVHKRKIGAASRISTNSNIYELDNYKTVANREKRTFPKARVTLHRMKNPFLRSDSKTDEKYIQPNIVPNIEVENDNILDLFNRRPSSEVQVLTQQSAVISISSQSPSRNVTESRPPPISPDLFDNSSASHLFSQNSFEVPNGQMLVSNLTQTVLHDSMNTSNDHQDTSNSPNFVDIFNDHSVTVVNTFTPKVLNERESRVKENIFEITRNDMFNNVIELTSDSEETTAPKKKKADQIREHSSKDNKNSVYDLIDRAICMSSQETPKRPRTRFGLFKNSPNKTPLSRTKWLTKRSPTDGIHEALSKTPYRSRRLDVWFQDEGNIPTCKKTINRVKYVKPKSMLSSSEEDDC